MFRKALALLILLTTSVALADDALLSWSAPQYNCDGSALPATDLVGYNLYIGTVGRVAAGLPATSNGACDATDAVKPDNPLVATAYEVAKIQITDGAQLSYTYPNLSPGVTYYFAITAVSVTGESNLTNEVTKTAAAPTSPILLDPNCVSCSTYSGKLLLGETGTPITIAWETLSGDKTVNVFKYPGLSGAVPIATATVSADSFSWTPSRAGMYYVQVCSGTACTDSNANGGFLFYIKLAAPSGGGIN